MSAPHEFLTLGDFEPNDKNLVHAFKQGEDGSYQAIHDRYASRVHGICRRMLGHSHDAEEAAQEAFMRVFTALPNFNGRYQLGAWMSRIATNVCLDHLRSRSRHPSDSVDNDVLAEMPSLVVDQGPEDLLMESTERRRVRSVLQDLSPMHRAAIALREYEGMSYQDIAVALGMTEPQVKALLHRARKSFKKAWGPAGAAAFLPWRWLARIRRAGSPLGDAQHQITDAATSSLHAAASCSTILQQCTQLVGEKVVPAFAAVVIGAGSIVGGSLGGSASAGPAIASERPEVVPTAIVAGIREKATRRGDVRTAREVDPSRFIEEEENAVATSAPADPETQPAAPSPTPSPTPSPSSSAPASGGSEGEPAPTPIPPALGFDRGAPIPEVQPRVATTTVDCVSKKVTQRLDTTIADGETSYPIAFTFSSGELTMLVTKNGHQVGYDGGGGLTSSAITKGVMTLTYHGSYAWDGRGYPNSASLPEYGWYRAEFKLDCARNSVVQETVVFGIN